MKVLETERLVLRHLTLDDAEFILGLVNEPSWLRYIGDRGVRTIEDARQYLRTGPLASYQQFGFGLYLIEQKESGVPVGICGLLQRETLDDVDVGFALLPQFWRKGYAFESAAAVIEHGRDDFGLRRVVAITSPDNHGSIQLLEKLGFHFERRLGEGDSEVKLFGREL